MGLVRLKSLHDIVLDVNKTTDSSLEVWLMQMYFFVLLTAYEDNLQWWDTPRHVPSLSQQIKSKHKEGLWANSSNCIITSDVVEEKNFSQGANFIPSHTFAWNVLHFVCKKAWLSYAKLILSKNITHKSKHTLEQFRKSCKANSSDWSVRKESLQCIRVSATQSIHWLWKCD